MIRPLGDRVVVKRKEEVEQTVGGIIIPERSKEKPMEGVVVAVGPGRFDEKEGKFVPMMVEVGQRVMISKFVGVDLELEGVPYILLREDEILGIFD